ncbi:hypothetical protein D9M73_258030 [compost metagenome]
MHILDQVHQAFAEQVLDAVDHAQPTGLGKGHQGDLLVFGQRDQLLQAAAAEACIDRVMETNSHVDSWSC